MEIKKPCENGYCAECNNNICGKCFEENIPCECVKVCNDFHDWKA